MTIINGIPVRDTLETFVDPTTCALLVVDVQNDFCHPDGHIDGYKKDLSQIQAMLPTLVSFVSAAQDMGVRTVFVRQPTLPDGKSDSPAWPRFKCRDRKSPDTTLKGSWGAELAGGLATGPNGIEVEKYHPDAFVSSNLDQMLRANGIGTVLVFGTTTERCVESMVRGASFHDYYIVVVKDLIGSPNPVRHEGSMRLFAARYPMAASDEILAAWKEMRSPAVAA